MNPQQAVEDIFLNEMSPRDRIALTDATILLPTPLYKPNVAIQIRFRQK